MKRVLVHFFLVFAVFSLGASAIRSVFAQTPEDGDSRLNAIEQFEQYEEELGQTNALSNENSADENTNAAVDPLANEAVDGQNGNEPLDSAAEQDGQNPFQDATEIRNDIEKLIHDSESRSAFARFFIGSKYKQLSAAKQKNADLKREIAKIENVLATISAQTTINAWQNKLDDLRAYVQDAETRIDRQEKSFSLFGWLIRLITT